MVTNTAHDHGTLNGSLDAKEANGIEFELVPHGTPILPGQTRLIALAHKAECKERPVVPAYPMAANGALDWELASQQATAERNTTVAPIAVPLSAVSANARLDFAVTQGSFVSLQVGSQGATTDTVSSDLASLVPPTCTATPLPVCFGNGSPVAGTIASASTLQVIVKSNAGQINLKAQVVTALTSGVNTIPMSQILLTSSDATDLPAPALPDTGTGTSVSVTPTSFSGKVTGRSANWSFAYVNTVSPVAGTYNGQVVFIATSPLRGRW